MYSCFERTKHERRTQSESKCTWPHPTLESAQLVRGSNAAPPPPLTSRSVLHRGVRATPPIGREPDAVLTVGGGGGGGRREGGLGRGD